MRVQETGKETLKEGRERGDRKEKHLSAKEVERGRYWEVIELLKSRARTVQTLRESHRLGFVCLAVGTARRLSVWPIALFLQSSGISQASAISPDKGMELFSLSHQQLGLSTIRPIGPKPLCYCQLTEANTGDPVLMLPVLCDSHSARRILRAC